jgi:hypothetical protein
MPAQPQVQYLPMEMPSAPPAADAPPPYSEEGAPPAISAAVVDNKMSAPMYAVPPSAVATSVASQYSAPPYSVPVAVQPAASQYSAPPYSVPASAPVPVTVAAAPKVVAPASVSVASEFRGGRVVVLTSATSRKSLRVNDAKMNVSGSGASGEFAQWKVEIVEAGAEPVIMLQSVRFPKQYLRIGSASHTNAGGEGGRTSPAHQPMRRPY